jgi:hypothetical protein
MPMRKLALAGMLLMVLGTGSNAFAWGCVAESTDGASGYSSNWPSEQDAQTNAIKECEVRSSTDDCAVQSCDPTQ